MRTAEPGVPGLPEDAERGAIGGGEVVALGFLTFVVAALLIANAWGIVDAKIAVTAAAREAARAFVEARDPSSAVAAGVAAARETMAGHGHDGGAPVVPAFEGRFARCARVTVTVSYTVPAVVLPWIGGLADTAVTGTHSEIVDPYRSGLPVDGDPSAAEDDCAA